MRKFIVSDLHGCGDVYDSIMGYLENVSKTDTVELYINGDLIDRGLDGYRMLEDVYERIHGKGDIKIHYLGGNHELMMYRALLKRKPGKSVSHWCDWMMNGGWVIEGELDVREDGEEKCEEFKNFLGDLDLYHIFDEKLIDQRILLVHAQAPKKALEAAPMKIKDNDIATFNTVWMRREEREQLLFGLGKVIGLNRIGLDGYYTIIGHTPVFNSKGFMVDREEKYMNIDGGCAAYAVGKFEHDHVPLLEIKKDRVDVLVFNHNNEIIKGYYFDGRLIIMDDASLDAPRSLLNPIYNGQAKTYQKTINEIKDL